MKKLIILTVAALSLLFVTNVNAQIVRGSSSVSSVSSAQKSKKAQKTGARYQGELNFGYATGGKMNFKYDDGSTEKDKTDFSRPLIETVHGVRFLHDYLFVGAGFGAQYMYGKMSPDYDDSDNWGVLSIPVFANIKGYYPVSNDFAPYLSLSLGGSIFTCSNWNESYSGGWEDKHKGGFYCDFGVGLNYKKFNVGFGLQHQSMKFVELYHGDIDEETKASVNSFYVKLGLKF